MDKIVCIAANTFRELIRSKVLYSVMFFAAILIAVSAFFGTVTIGNQVAVIKDFGLFSISLFTVAFAVISGAALLNKELSKKTIYNVLAKAVSRSQFLCGKFLGMLLTAWLMIFLMGSSLAVFLYFFEGSVDWNMAHAYFSMALELTVVCAAAIFFSTIVVTPILSGLFTFGIFLAGRETDYLLYFITHGQANAFTSGVLKTLYYALPHLGELNMSDSVVYAQTAGLTLEHYAWLALYALAYSGVLLALGAAIFRRREFN